MLKVEWIVCEQSKTIAHSLLATTVQPGEVGCGETMEPDLVSQLSYKPSFRSNSSSV